MLAFVDESGTDGVDLLQKGNTEYYVVAALICEHAEEKELCNHCDRVAANFQSPEMKSSHIGKNDERRLGIVRQLAGVDIDCQIAAVAVSKSEIKSLGMHFPKSFIKRVHRALLERVTNEYPHVNVVCDEIKSRQFQEEYQNYLYQRANLFEVSQTQFRFADSSYERLLQAADVFAGTLARLAFNMVGASWREPMSEVIKPRVLDFAWFPRRPQGYCAASKYISSEAADSRIEACAVERCDEYIEKNYGEDDLRIAARVRFLERLRSALNLGDTDWVSTRDLRDVVKMNSDRALRAHVVGPLRSEGVLIASRRGGGYKIPTCVNDVREFLRNQREKVGPMLGRVRKARDVVQAYAEIDVLEEEEFRGLQEAVKGIAPWT